MRRIGVVSASAGVVEVSPLQHFTGEVLVVGALPDCEPPQSHGCGGCLLMVSWGISARTACGLLNAPCHVRTVKFFRAKGDVGNLANV